MTLLLRFSCNMDKIDRHAEQGVSLVPRSTYQRQFGRGEMESSGLSLFSQEGRLCVSPLAVVVQHGGVRSGGKILCVYSSSILVRRQKGRSSSKYGVCFPRLSFLYE